MPDQPVLTTHADPALETFVEAVEKDLLTEILQEMEKGELTEDQAQQIAQEFLALLPIQDKQDLLNKLRGIGETSKEAQHVYHIYIADVEEEKRTKALEHMRIHIQRGDLEQALATAKNTYGA